MGPRPELLHFPKSATPLHIWGTKVGSWKYRLLVKSPTMDGPLKRQTGFEIYCHTSVHLSKVCKSLQSSSNKASNACPCRGQPRAMQPDRHMLIPSRKVSRDFLVWVLAGPWQLIQVLGMAWSWLIFYFYLRVYITAWERILLLRPGFSGF